MKNTDDDSICSRLERLINEFEQSKEIESTEIGRQFAQLQRLMLDNQDVLSCSEGKKSINRLKNRYKDILPYDKHRVRLRSNSDSDYINASFIEDFYGRQRYIAAQGPIEESLNDFFQMIWEYEITSIICTANVIEAGRFKFHRYWPEDDEESLQIGSYLIREDLSSEKRFICDDYQIRSLILTRGDIQRQILLYHVLHWPDHEIPNDEKSIVNLLTRLYQDRTRSIDSPILVHCSAGCGRTGSLIAIDLCRLLLNDEHLFLSKNYQPYPVLKIALHIRQFRMALIQTLKQYFFVYKLFFYMMKTNGNLSFYSIANKDENQTDLLFTAMASTRRPSIPLQITLQNPPIRRRLLNGSTISNSPSPVISSSEFFSSSSSSKDTPESPAAPPPTPPSQLPPPIPPRYSHENHSISIQIQNEQEHFRSTRRRTSSTSLDRLSISSTKHQYQYLSEQGANSD